MGKDVCPVFELNAIILLGSAPKDSEISECLRVGLVTFWGSGESSFIRSPAIE